MPYFRTLSVRHLLVAISSIAGFSVLLGIQQSRMERFVEMSREAERRGTAEAYHGITANGAIETGLFNVRSTGVSTAPVRQAASAFLDSLTESQREATL